MSDELRHVWLSNAAFKNLTGIRKVCLLCGTPSNRPDDPAWRPDRICPGKKSDA